jgi:hypothetical protein
MEEGGRERGGREGERERVRGREGPWERSRGERRRRAGSGEAAPEAASEMRRPRREGEL